MDDKIGNTSVPSVRPARVMVDDEVTARFEATVLALGARHAGQAVTCSVLFEEVWDHHHVEPTHVIDAHIAKLRHILDPEGTCPMIEKVRGGGYILRAPD